MKLRIALSASLALFLGVAVLTAAALSPQHADAFAKKVAIISQQSRRSCARTPAARRTAVSETELNSWFAYRSRPLLPVGMTEPQITIVGDGKVNGAATVDLDAVARSRRTGSADRSVESARRPAAGDGQRRPAHAERSGPLRAASGSRVGRADSQVDPAGAGLVLFANRRGSGRISIDEPFALPAGIRQIEVGQGQAVIVQ